MSLKGVISGLFRAKTQEISVDLQDLINPVNPYCLWPISGQN